MKRIILLLTLSMFLLAPLASANDDLKPVLVTVTPNQIFSPMGFDSNDNSQVVLDGMLRSTCYKVGPVKKHVDRKNGKVTLRSFAYYYPGSWCAEVMIPYQLTVNLGVLPEGNFSILVEDEDDRTFKASKLPVALAASANPDDYLYAPVEEAHFSQRTKVMKIWGTFTNSCMRMKDVKVRSFPKKHVVEVLPIAALDKDDCEDGLYPFNIKVKLKGKAKGRTLVHIRSLNGKSINQVVNF